MLTDNTAADYEYALFLADLDRAPLADVDGAATGPIGDWREVEGAEELPE